MLKWVEHRILSFDRIAHECILLACQRGRLEIAEWILCRAKWLSTSHLDEALIHCIRNGDVRMMEWALTRPRGLPRLHLAMRQAAMVGNLDIIEWLCRRFPLWALLRDPQNRSQHLSATMIRLFILRHRDKNLVLRAADLHIFVDCEKDSLLACLEDFLDLYPTHEVPEELTLREWIHLSF